MSKRYLVLGLSAVFAISLTVPALGGPGNPVASTAVSAAKALKVAKKAKQKANAAQSTADTALSTANQARTAAATADTKATNAQTSANAAQASANAAQTSANTANNTANTRFNDTIQVAGTATANNGDDDKSDSVACTSGDHVTGGGWFIGGTDNDNQSVVTSASYGDSWTVAATEITASGNWQLQAIAQCAQT